MANLKKRKQPRRISRRLPRLQTRFAKAKMIKRFRKIKIRILTKLVRKLKMGRASWT